MKVHWVPLAGVQIIAKKEGACSTASHWPIDEEIHRYGEILRRFKSLNI